MENNQLNAGSAGSGVPSGCGLSDGVHVLPAMSEANPSTDPPCCPICNESRPEKFGVCRARATGRNLYCKECVNQKMRDSRRALRKAIVERRLELRGYADRRSKRRRSIMRRPDPDGSQAPLPLIGLAPNLKAQPKTERDENGILVGREILRLRHPHEDRVLSAIHQGARTQREILEAINGSPRRGTVMEMDHVGDSLANLMFSAPVRVKTDIIEGRRVYVPVAGSVGILPAKEREARTSESFSLSSLGGIVEPKPDRSAVIGRRSSSWRAA